MELSMDLKCQYHYQVYACQHLNWKLWMCKQKYSLRKCSGTHLQSLFSIRQNNTWCIRSHTSVSKKAFIKPRHAQDGQTHLWGIDKGPMPVSYNPFKQNR